MSRWGRRFGCLLGTFAGIALLAGPAGAFSGSTQATPPAPLPALTAAQAQQIGAAAYVYGIAPLESLRLEQQQTSVTVPDSLGDAPINQIGNDTTLASANNQIIVGPNLDTLYTSIHADLSNGPYVLHVPEISGGRYYSFEFLDPYTNVFDYIGTRTTGDGGGNYAIVGPHYHGRLPDDLTPIRSAYDHIWIVGRTQVNGPSDVLTVNAIQAQYEFIPLCDFVQFGLTWTPPPPTTVITTPTPATVPTGLAFFDALGDYLKDNPPPAAAAPLLARLAKVGIGPGLHPSTENLPAATLAGLAAAATAGPANIATLRELIAIPSVLTHHGWYVPAPNIGHFGTDYSLRAVIAVYGIAANIPAEAIYPTGILDNTDRPLTGADDYEITFQSGDLPPAKYFWSLTMYDAEDYLVANPINRYSLGSNTTGLVYNTNGSLTLYIGASPPAEGESNWLPSPASGAFTPIMRLYGPEASALNGTYVYPAIVNMGTDGASGY